MDQRIIEKLLSNLSENQEVALVTVTQAQGSCPRGVGSMMIVNRGGELVAGTIGGGSVENRALEDGAVCIRDGISKAIHYELNSSGREDALPMICGGSLDIFVQVFKKQEELIIAGAGHIGCVLSKLAKIMGYRVIVIDSRKAFASKERFPEADVLIAGGLSESLKGLPIGDRTSIVIVTHGHLHDQEALESVINSEARYIGMIGSRKKIKGIFDNLIQLGISKEKFASVYSPIGMDLGGETPEEISLSILAEIQAVRNGKMSRVSGEDDCEKKVC